MGIMVKHRVHVTLERYKVRLHKLSGNFSFSGKNE